MPKVDLEACLPDETGRYMTQFETMHGSQFIQLTTSEDLLCRHLVRHQARAPRQQRLSPSLFLSARARTHVCTGAHPPALTHTGTRTHAHTRTRAHAHARTRERTNKRNDAPIHLHKYATNRPSDQLTQQLSCHSSIHSPHSPLPTCPPAHFFILPLLASVYAARPCARAFAVAGARRLHSDLQRARAREWHYRGDRPALRTLPPRRVLRAALRFHE
eukprot:232905-Pleurochrysis_carterae.AAC.1